ncbi:MAG TPA: MerR family transcriptional regulator [Nakamurella sp.]
MSPTADVDEPDAATQPSMQIGEVAARTDLSVRTIRHWEEMGLVTPSARTPGGFRLYSDEDVARIKLLRFMKPLNFTLEQMRNLLALREMLATPDAASADRLTALVWPASASAPDPATSRTVAQDLLGYVQLAERRLEKLHRQVAEVEEFVQRLRAEAQQGSTSA